MKTLIWLDDCRDPFAEGSTWIKEYSPIGSDVHIIWCKSFDDFCEMVELKYGIEFSMPDGICFDHDLGMDEEMNVVGKTGYDCAKWLVDFCIEHHQKLPKWNIHSSNPVGAENIRSYLTNFEKHYE